MSQSEKKLREQNRALRAVLLLLIIAILVSVIGSRTVTAFANDDSITSEAEAEASSETVEEITAADVVEAEITDVPEADKVEADVLIAETEPDVPAETAPLAAFPAGKYQGFFQCENGRTLDYWLLVPQNCTVGMPLIVYLHNDRYLGWGNFEALGETSALASAVLNEFGENFPAIVLIPQAHYAEEGFVGAGVNDAVFGLINSVADEYLVDRSNISITGSGRGAAGVWYFIDTYGSFFSCAMPISCGPAYTTGFGKACAGVPVLAFVGSGDDFNVYGGDMQAACNSIGSFGGNAVLQTVDSSSHFDTEYAVYTSTTINWLASGGDGIQAFQ